MLTAYAEKLSVEIRCALMTQSWRCLLNADECHPPLSIRKRLSPIRGGWHGKVINLVPAIVRPEPTQESTARGLLEILGGLF